MCRVRREQIISKKLHQPSWHAGMGHVQSVERPCRALSACVLPVVQYPSSTHEIFIPKYVNTRSPG